ncbi:MAG: peptidoglycan DD-metalloendopeptidase family protein [Acidimicrobiia bacterium]|nr:peptidoglycan DD-metalloendopeptidase family protein [Acidimicrobiia bacterium]
MLIFVLFALMASETSAQDTFFEDRQRQIEQKQLEIQERRAQQTSLQAEALFAIEQLDVAEALIEELDTQLKQINAWIAAANTRLATVQLAQTAAQKRVNEAQQRAANLSEEITFIQLQIQAQVVQIYLDLAYEPTFLLQNGDPNRNARRQFYIEELGGDAQSLIDRLRRALDEQQLAVEEAEQAQLEIAQAQANIEEALVELNKLQQAQKKLQEEWDRKRNELLVQIELEAQEQREVEYEIARLDAGVAAIEAEIQQERDRRRLAELERQRQARLAELERERNARIASLRERESRGEFTNPPFLQPIPGSVGSGFGNRIHPIFGTERFHAGIDIGGNTGDPIRAAASGTVIQVKARTGYGNTVMIDHGDGWSTLYAHLSTFAVSVGQQVGLGDIIGAVGNTGWSTGPHLHFEIRYEGVPQDPVRYLSA